MSATKVANGQVTDAAQFNSLVDDIDDITVGHAHTGAAGGGKKVSHGNLLDGAIASGLTHAQINAHIGSTPGTATQGVHGLNALASVMGLLGATQYTFEVGADAVDFIDGAECSGTVTTGLTAVVGVIIVPSCDWMAFNSGLSRQYFYVSGILGGASFEAHFSGGNTWDAGAVGGLTFFYLAWGTKS